MSLLRRGVVRVGARLAWSAVLLAAVAACGSTGDVEQAGAGTSGLVITGAGGSGGHSSSHASSSTSSTGAGGDGGATAQGAPYPFVLAHGFFGFQEFAGLDFETYYHGVKAHLASKGEIVDTPTVDPFNDSEFRGHQLVLRIEDFLAATGAAKVNIIGHSQGGLDARFVASTRPDLVASVVTVATPHHGSPIGDIAMKLLADPNAQAVINELAKLIGGPLYDQIGNKTSVTKALELFAQPGITAFNDKHPDSPGVFYASISGRSALHLLDDDCKGDVVVPFVQPWNSTLDPIDPLLGIFSVVLASTHNYANDGLVRAKDGRWGEYWGCVPADHLDEIGQLLGDGAGLGNGWKHLDFYTQLIAYMRSLGY